MKIAEPVIFDVQTHLDDPNSSAHFVAVTGAAAGQTTQVRSRPITRILRRARVKIKHSTA